MFAHDQPRHFCAPFLGVRYLVPAQAIQAGKSPGGFCLVLSDGAPIFGGFGTVCEAGGVPAYGQSEGLTFDIPFNFIVEQQRLPAGQYLVAPSAQNVLLMRRIEGRSAVMVLTQGIVSYERRETARLVSNCYDRRCCFAQAWLNTGSIR